MSKKKWGDAVRVTKTILLDVKRGQEGPRILAGFLFLSHSDPGAR